MDLYTLNQIPLGLLQEKIHELNDKKSKLEHELQEIEDENENTKSRDHMIELVHSFGDVLDRGNFDEIRATIGGLIDYIEIKGEDVDIHWNFS